MRRARALRARDHRRRPDALLQQGPLRRRARDLGRHLQRREGEGEPAEALRLVGRAASRATRSCMTYLPLLNSYGGNFVNDDWSPGLRRARRASARSSGCSASSRTCPSGVAEFDTDQETQVLLAGQVHGADRVHRPRPARRRPELVARSSARSTCAATPSQEKSGPAIGTFICGIAVGRPEPRRARSSSSSGSRRDRSRPTSRAAAAAPR